MDLKTYTYNKKAMPLDCYVSRMYTKLFLKWKQQKQTTSQIITAQLILQAHDSKHIRNTRCTQKNLNCQRIAEHHISTGMQENTAASLHARTWVPVKNGSEGLGGGVRITSSSSTDALPARSTNQHARNHIKGLPKPSKPHTHCF